MGIYDREYYGDEQRDRLDFFRGDGAATRTLIFANVVVYVLQVLFRGQIENYFAANTDAISGGELWRLFTANFLHDPRSPFHLIFNMLIVWFAGRELEYIYGRQKFYKFYFGACLFSMTVWFLTEKALHPGDVAVALGASGAAMASMMLLTMHAPRRTVIFIFFPMELWVLMTIYVVVDAVQLLQVSRGVGSSQVAFAGHLGGVLFGYLYKTYDFSWFDPQYWLEKRRRSRFKVVGRDWSDESVRTAERSKSRVPTVKVSSGVKPSVKTSPVTATPPSDTLDSRVDEILIKIARDGQGALSEEERRLLEEASRRARSRRGSQ